MFKYCSIPALILNCYGSRHSFSHKSFFFLWLGVIKTLPLPIKLLYIKYYIKYLDLCRTVLSFRTEQSWEQRVVWRKTKTMSEYNHRDSSNPPCFDWKLSAKISFLCHNHNDRHQGLQNSSLRNDSWYPGLGSHRNIPSLIRAPGFQVRWLQEALEGGPLLRCHRAP